MNVTCISRHMETQPCTMDVLLSCIETIGNGAAGILANLDTFVQNNLQWILCGPCQLREVSQEVCSPPQPNRCSTRTTEDLAGSLRSTS
ncbi:hypothetical protein GDO78_002377 [Eleutherodactylus coqui]|uniref:Uncharacterized protein n=1 Tax=Eleutherodactylus coqui TaxID=57060 RepID=A0A8J6K317_ELECQ|nr:hypothetical protein GDO78_002377 [Eleutherodactylus coqui]